MEREAGWGSFAVPKNDIEGVHTPLYPFRPDKDHWYKSDMVRSVERFGYTYPELQNKEDLLDKLGETYVPIWKSINQSKKHIPTAGEHILPQVHTVRHVEVQGEPATAEQLKAIVAEMPPAEALLETSLEPSKPFLRDLAPKNKYLEWITNIGAEKHALDGAYTVHVFLGDPAESNVALWPVAPSHVGTFAPLGQPSTTKCGKCVDDQIERIQVTGQIPLTVALVERYLAGIIDDLSEESVKPYLTKNLHWRVAKVTIALFLSFRCSTPFAIGIALTGTKNNSSMAPSSKTEAKSPTSRCLSSPTRSPYQRMTRSFLSTHQMSRSIPRLPRLGLGRAEAMARDSRLVRCLHKVKLF